MLMLRSLFLILVLFSAGPLYGDGPSGEETAFLIPIAVQNEEGFLPIGEKPEKDAVRDFVQSFYDWYVPVAHKGSGNASDIALEDRPAAFDPSLVRQLREDTEARKAFEYYIPRLDFDPFLASKDPCDRYEVESLNLKDESYMVDVRGVGGCEAHDTPDLVAEVILKNGELVFTNFHYPEPRSKDLLAILKRLQLDQLIYPYPSGEEGKKIQNYYDYFMEEFFPIRNRLGLSIGYKSYEDYYVDELEYSFVFANLPPVDLIITVYVSLPDYISLFDQLVILSQKSPHADVNEIRSGLKINQWELTEEKCSAVKQQWEKFIGLKLEMESAKDSEARKKGEMYIRLHPRIHILRAHISGGEMNLDLTDSEHPYVKWAVETRGVLQKCINEEKGTKIDIKTSNGEIIGQPPDYP